MGESKRFPIQRGKLPTYDWIPWEMIAQHEEQAMRNHRQSLEELRERKGLLPCEAVAVLLDRPWRKMPGNESAYALNRLAREFEKTPELPDSAIEALARDRVETELRKRIAALEVKIEAVQDALTRADCDDPEHVIHMHSKDLPDYYRGLCAAVAKAREAAK